MATRFIALAANHSTEAIALAQAEAERERAFVPALPLEDARDRLADAVRSVVERGLGVAAIDESGALVSYLAFYGPIERFFGSATGAYAPLHGYAASGDNRERLLGLLVQHAAERLVNDRITSLAITMYAHDIDAARALTLTGFGIRNADAIRDLRGPITAPPSPGYSFRELSGDEIVAIHPLENGLVRHLRSSPTFLQVTGFTVEAFLADRVEGARFFVASAGDDIVGYLKVSDEGETFYTRTPGMPNITGAYLLPEHRGHGVYDGLLAHVIETLRREGARLLGVDFETMNPTARHFWDKYFDTYTYSYARRIDDATPGTDA